MKHSQWHFELIRLRVEANKHYYQKQNFCNKDCIFTFLTFSVANSSVSLVISRPNFSANVPAQGLRPLPSTLGPLVEMPKFGI